MSVIWNLAAKMGLRERRKGGRVLIGGLEAFYGDGEGQKPAKVNDMSPSGIYLMVEDRISPGTEVLVVLKKKTPLDSQFDAQVRMRARVARVDEHGLGLEFLHESIDAAGWSELVVKSAELSPKSDGVRVFRVARALAFLLRISPAFESHFLKIITDRLNRESSERAIEIVLKAEDMVLLQGRPPKTNVDATLIQRILEYGSKGDTYEEDVERCWAGLLATSSLEGTKDEASVKLVVTLSRLDVVSMRILSLGCSKAMEAGWKSGLVFAHSLYSSVSEIKKITQVRDHTPIEWALNRLHDLGLLEMTPKSATFEPITQVNVTPTGEGLKLFARCSGQLEVPDTCPGGNAV